MMSGNTPQLVVNGREMEVRRFAALSKELSEQSELYSNCNRKQQPLINEVVPMVSIRRGRESFFIASAIAEPRIASAICVPPTVSFHFRTTGSPLSVVQDGGQFCELDECRIGGTCSSSR